MTSLIMFDLDGTLVDSGTDITTALNHAIEPYHMGRLTRERAISLVGEGVTTLIGKLLGEEHIALKDEVLERFITYYEGHLTLATRPYPGVVAALEGLSNCKKAVISNKKESLSKKLLQELDLLKHFECVFGGDSSEEKKPSPRPLLAVMDILDMRPEDAMMVGDSVYDIRAGTAAGVTTVAVTYGFRAAETLTEADFMIDSMPELLQVEARLRKKRGR